MGIADQRGTARMLPALLSVAALMVLAGCQQAASTSPGISFGTETLMVAVVPTLTEGAPMIPVTLPEAMGGDGHTYSVTSMVPGLSFNPTSRVLSGTPTVAGTYPMTYTATTSDGDEASLSFTVKVLSSFLGTWASAGEWREDDQLLGRWEQALTFTKSRYILHRSHIRTGSTSVDNVWVESGTWEAGDTTITRIWLDDHDDDDETDRIERIVRKNYLWSESRDVLCMEHWADSEENLDSVSCERYERMPSPAPADLLGTWTSTNPEDTWQHTFVLTLAEFKFSRENSENGDTFVLTGTYEVVPEELFVLVTTVDATWNGESVLPNPDNPWKVGVISRWAFAPTHNPTTLAVSTRGAEMDPNPDGPGFIDGADLPHGEYGLMVEKQ